jgi:hypothetical protein
MAITREVPRYEWNDFLPLFSIRNQGRQVRLESTIQPGDGVPVIAERQPLLGLTMDPKGSASPAIEVMLGGLEPHMAELVHIISRPTRVWVQEELDGLGLGIEIDSLEEGRTLVVFLPEKALPNPEAARI